MNDSFKKITAFCAAALIGMAALFLLAKAPAVEAAGGDSCGCHANKSVKKFVHLPVKKGDCDLCHKPSGEKHPKFKKEAFLLKDNGKAGLCAECHERKDSKKHVHPPVAAGDCSDCHDPHQSDNRYQLKEAGSALCFSCHEKSKLERAFPHKPIADGDCMGCHDPHHSDHGKLLKEKEPELCMKCHKKADFNGKSVHKPVADGACSACHAAHGTTRQNLLKQAFPAGMYQSYDKAHFELCFSCHKSGLADKLSTGKETNFRNGMNNLHQLHVNRAAKGRSCKACHAPHAAGQPFLISTRISGFGRWRIPIRYTRTLAGGTCVVGCHKPKSYDRTNPVNNP